MELACSTKTVRRPKQLQHYSYKPENRKVQHMKIPRSLRVKTQAVRLLESCKMGPIICPEMFSISMSRRRIYSESGSRRIAPVILDLCAG